MNPTSGIPNTTSNATTYGPTAQTGSNMNLWSLTPNINLTAFMTYLARLKYKYVMKAGNRIQRIMFRTSDFIKSAMDVLDRRMKKCLERLEQRAERFCDVITTKDSQQAALVKIIMNKEEELKKSEKRMMESLCENARLRGRYRASVERGAALSRQLKRTNDIARLKISKAEQDHNDLICSLDCIEGNISEANKEWDVAQGDYESNQQEEPVSRAGSPQSSDSTSSTLTVLSDASYRSLTDPLDLLLTILNTININANLHPIEIIYDDNGIERHGPRPKTVLLRLFAWLYCPIMALQCKKDQCCTAVLRNKDKPITVMLHERESEFTGLRTERRLPRDETRAAEDVLKQLCAKIEASDIAQGDRNEGMRHLGDFIRTLPLDTLPIDSGRATPEAHEVKLEKVKLNKRINEMYAVKTRLKKLVEDLQKKDVARVFLGARSSSSASTDEVTQRSSHSRFPSLPLRIDEKMLTSSSALDFEAGGRRQLSIVRWDRTVSLSSYAAISPPTSPIERLPLRPLSTDLGTCSRDEAVVRGLLK